MGGVTGIPRREKEMTSIWEGGLGDAEHKILEGG